MIAAAIMLIYGALCAPALLFPSYLDSPLGLVAATPLLSIYLFHGLGIPGLLKNGGACGWGWCAPTLFGWGFLIVFWLLVTWLLARLVAGLLTSSRP